MKKIIFGLLACISMTQTYALDTGCTASCCDIFGFESALTVGAGGGYRQDKVEWTVYPAWAPETYIKEEWDGMYTGIVTVGAQFLACERFLVRADFDCGWWNDHGTQSIKTYSTETGDLLGDVHAKTKGRVYDVSGGLGYQFNFCCYRFAIAPFAGYSHHHIKLVSKHYHVEGVEDNETEFKSHNTYNSHWSGPLLGFTTAYQICCDWQIAFSYYYHWAKFKSSIKERFAEDTPGIIDGPLYGTQVSNWGYGNEFNVFTTYEFCPDWLLVLDFNYKAFKATKGKLKHHDDIKSPMRDIEWETWNASMNVAYVF